jgi:hypothetical protein
MRQAGYVRGAIAALAIGWFGSTGCIQNYYPAPVCGEPGGMVQYGSTCDVPAASGTTVAQGSNRTTTTNAKPPSVVVSQPSTGSRLSWRRSDPEHSIATTTVEGAIDDTTVTR